MNLALQEIREKEKEKTNLIWLEATGCSGNIISLLNAEDPDVVYLLRNMVTLTYDNSLMGEEGEAAYELFLRTLETRFILAVEGAVSTRDQGVFTILARYQGQWVSAMDMIQMAGERAQHVLAVGTCASYGGISAAVPNPSACVSVPDFLKRDVIRVPGCPIQPDWVTGTLAHLLAFGLPQLDAQGRPILFYGVTIHDFCPRRSFFDQGIFAQRLGERTCMFKLGCRGPITRTDCPTRRWNDRVNWPIGDNTPCIGCARQGFPDGMEPFVRY